MKKLTLATGLLLLIGCGDPGVDVSSATDVQPQNSAETELAEPESTEPESTEADPVTDENSAEYQLAAAKKRAAGENKRILVHLGATW